MKGFCVPPFEIGQDAEFVQLVEHATGQRAGAVAFGTESVVLGPGKIEQAHRPDEYLELDSIQPTIEILERLIRPACLEK